MRKSPPSSKTPRRSQTRSRSKAEQKAAIQATLDRLDRLQPETPKAASLIALLRSWLSDESGYDEQTWPKLKTALDEERERVEARRLFDG